MRKPFYLAIFAFALGSVTNAAALAQSCTLKRQQVIGTPGCFGFVGYSGGQRVGFFKWHGMLVTTGKGCPSEYLNGSLVSSNSISVGGSTLMLSPDCRSTL
jgi:hypothetical protein